LVINSLSGLTSADEQTIPRKTGLLLGVIVAASTHSGRRPLWPFTLFAWDIRKKAPCEKGWQLIKGHPQSNLKVEKPWIIRTNCPCMNTPTPPSSPPAIPGVAVILAGGRSQRFGRDKGNFHWKGRSFASHIRQIAVESGLKAHVMRKDLVTRCGPLGGLYTGFKRHHSPWILFLACDMPLIRPEYLVQMVTLFQKKTRHNEALITQVDQRLGFPLILARSALSHIENQLVAQDVSLRTLFKSLDASMLKPPQHEASRFVNVNYRSELELLNPDTASRSRP
jgi:molybdopterin-guanine dinucleotide biosynthesis protein A